MVGSPQIFQISFEKELCVFESTIRNEQKPRLGVCSIRLKWDFRKSSLLRCRIKFTLQLPREKLVGWEGNRQGRCLFFFIFFLKKENRITKEQNSLVARFLCIIV